MAAGKSMATPRLRFPEYRGDADWNERPLKEICEINPPNIGLPAEFFYIDLESVESGVLRVRKRLERRNAPSRAQRFLKNGDVVFQIVRPYQRNNLLVNFDDGATYVATTGYAQLRANQSKSFLYQAIHTDAFVDRVIAKCTGSNYPAINSSDLADVLLPLPWNPAEQQKIADCLTSLDEVIAAQGQKVEALKTYKRGLMQQLFPRDGEIVPRLRFPEFFGDPEWSTVAMGEVLVGRPEYGINAPAVQFSPDLPAYLRITDIDDSGRFIREGKTSVDIEATDDNYLSDGDIALARTGASVGKSYLCRREDGRLVFAGFLIRIRLNQKKAVPAFVSNFLTTKQYWDWVRITSARSGQPGINSSEYATLQMPIPPRNGKDGGLAEQQCIADHLSSLDVQVAGESDRLSALKTHKKGLMQQLFPSQQERSA